MVRRCLERDEPFGVVLIRDGREVGPGAALDRDGRHGRRDPRGVQVQRRPLRPARRGHPPVPDRDVAVGPRALPGRPTSPSSTSRVGDRELAEQLTAEVTQRFVRYLGLLQPREGEDGAEIDVQVEVDVEDDEDRTRARWSPVARPIAASGEEVRVTIPDDPTVLSYLLSGIIQVDQPRRQDLLEAETTVDRIEELLRLIEREITLLERRLRNYTVDPRSAAIRRN